MTRSLFACLLVAPLSGAPPAKAIARIRVAWADDLRSKKVDDIVDLYATDAVFLDPDGKHHG